MTDNFDIQRLKNEYPDFFEQVSSNLLDFILSKETSSKIAEICLKNGIEDEGIIEKISYRIALILLNQIPEENFSVALEKGVQLDPKTAREIAIDVKLHVFNQAKTISFKETGIENKKNQISKTSLFTYMFPEEESEESFKKDAGQETIE